jgi:hypothetical protein
MKCAALAEMHAEGDQVVAGHDRRPGSRDGRVFGSCVNASTRCGRNRRSL